MSDRKASPSANNGFTGDAEASRDCSSVPRQDRRYGRVPRTSRRENDMRPSSPYSTVETIITDPVITPSTLDNTNRHNQDSNIFIDDSFNTGSFRRSDFGSYARSQKKTHGSYARSEATSTSLDDQLHGLANSYHPGELHHHDMKSNRGANIGSGDGYNHKAKRLYRRNRSPIPTFDDASDTDTASKDFVSRANGGNYHAHEWCPSEHVFSANYDDHSVTSSTVAFHKELLKPEREPRAGMSVPASSAEGVADGGVRRAPTKYTFADVCAGAGGMPDACAGPGFRFRDIDHIDGVAVESATDWPYDFFDNGEAARRSNSPVHVLHNRLNAGHHSDALPRWDDLVCGSTLPSEDLLSRGHRGHGRNRFMNYDQHYKGGISPSPSLSLRSKLSGEHRYNRLKSSHPAWDGDTEYSSPGSRSGTADRVHYQDGWACPVYECPWHAPKPAAAKAPLADAQAYHTALKDEIAYLHDRLSQQQNTINSFYEKPQPQDKVVPASHATQMSDIVTTGANEVDFLRGCISNASISRDDRYKALGILSTLQGGAASIETPQLLRSNATYHHDGGDPALARVELQMAAMTRDVIKVKAYNKFQRMQQDSDRLARIEEKLSAPKASKDDRIMAVIEVTTRKIDKLGDRVSKLKEFSRDGTPKSNIKNEVQEIADQVLRLQRYVQGAERDQRSDINGLSREVGSLQARLEEVSLFKQCRGGKDIHGSGIKARDLSAKDITACAPTKEIPIPGHRANLGWGNGPDTASEATSSHCDSKRDGWGNSLSEVRGGTRRNTPARQKTQGKESVSGRSEESTIGWDMEKIHRRGWSPSVAETRVATRAGFESNAQSLAKGGWGSPVTRRVHISEQSDDGCSNPHDWRTDWGWD